MSVLLLAAVSVSCKEAPKRPVILRRIVDKPTRTPSTPPRITQRPVVPVAPSTPRPGAASLRSDGSIWDCIALHESGSNWQDVNNEGGVVYYGGLHFLESTWISAGGQKYAGYPNEATREEQIAIAQSWLERTSWEQWPNTSRTCGVR